MANIDGFVRLCDHICAYPDCTHIVALPELLSPAESEECETTLSHFNIFAFHNDSDLKGGGAIENAVKVRTFYLPHP